MTNRTSWAWLENTYWYVTNPDLPALQFDADDNLLSWQVDQTVWHISGYKNGYFWGVTAALVYPADDADEDGRPGHLSLIGTVLPSGQVQITFVRGGVLRDSITVGYGNIVQLEGRWVFQMQMSTNNMGEQLLHWANMQQITPENPDWEKLPGVDYSVPEMLEDAEYPEFDE